MVTVAAPLGERSASFGGLWRWGRPAGIAALILILCFLSLIHGDAALWQPALDAARHRRRIQPQRLHQHRHDREPGRAGQHRRHLPGQDRLALALAVLLAWIVARTDTPGRGVLEVPITLPFFIPPILTATAWAMLGNAQVGTINLVWRWLTGSDTTLVNVYSYGGVIWHMMQYSTPFIFLFVVDAFRAMDPALEELSRMSGATR